MTLTARLQDIRERDLGAGQLGDVDRGAVLNRPSSVNRPGRHGDWLKHKGPAHADGVLLAVRQGRDGQCHGICGVGAGRVVALAGAGSVGQVGELVSLVYSRVDADADGALREVRLAAPPAVRAAA